MPTTNARVRPGRAGEIRRSYEKRRLMLNPMKVRDDVLALLEERKALQRAGEALMAAALPYGGDPNLKAAIDGFRAVLEGTA